MASSSSKVSESTSNMQSAPESGSVYKEKTMDIPWKSLIVQVESPVDFASLKKYKVNMEGLIETDRKSTRLNSSHIATSRMPSSA